MLTPKDIENKDRRSGYSHVRYCKRGPRDGTGWKPFQAERPATKQDRIAGIRASNPAVGPRRATAIEAAQDYCDYANSGAVVPSPILNRANHPSVVRQPTVVHPKRVEAYQLLKEAEADEQEDKAGYVYCIGDGEAVKVGKSKAHPTGRLKGIQTGNKRVCTLLAYKEVNDRHAVEADLHARFKKYQPDEYVGEWFRPAQEILDEFGIKSL